MLGDDEKISSNSSRAESEGEKAGDLSARARGRVGAGAERVRRGGTGIGRVWLVRGEEWAEACVGTGAARVGMLADEEEDGVDNASCWSGGASGPPSDSAILPSNPPASPSTPSCAVSASFNSVATSALGCTARGRTGVGRTSEAIECVCLCGVAGSVICELCERRCEVEERERGKFHDGNDKAGEQIEDSSYEDESTFYSAGECPLVCPALFHLLTRPGARTRSAVPVPNQRRPRPVSVSLPHAVSSA